MKSTVDWNTLDQLNRPQQLISQRTVLCNQHSTVPKTPCLLLSALTFYNLCHTPLSVRAASPETAVTFKCMWLQNAAQLYSDSLTTQKYLFQFLWLGSASIPRLLCTGSALWASSEHYHSKWKPSASSVFSLSLMVHALLCCCALRLYTQYVYLSFAILLPPPTCDWGIFHRETGLI